MSRNDHVVVCSSGGLADLLLSSVLPSTCQYYAVDQSPVQVQLTKSRLANHGWSISELTSLQEPDAGVTVRLKSVDVMQGPEILLSCLGLV